MEIENLTMIKPDNTALVLIDIKEKLTAVMSQRDLLLQNLQILIQGVQILSIPIYWVEQYPEGLGPTVPKIAALLEGLNPLSKLSFSACGQKEFLDKVKAGNRRTMLVAGMECHVCVYQTARDLLKEGYQVEVVSDATTSRSLQNKQVGVDKMLLLGAEVTSVETALFELLQTCGSQQFKQISRLLR